MEFICLLINPKISFIRVTTLSSILKTHPLVKKISEITPKRTIFGTRGSKFKRKEYILMQSIQNFLHCKLLY